MATTDFMDRIATNESQKTALVFALYNSIVFTLLGLFLLGLFAIYQVLYMFLVPILWAVLVGTVLFPFKRHLSDSLKSWLDYLDEENRPLLVGVVLLPLQVVNNITDNVYDTAISSTGFCCAIGYVVLKILCFEDVFIRLLSWFGSLYLGIDYLIQLTTYKWVIVITIVYATAIVAWICIQDISKVHKKVTRSLFVIIWIIAISNIANYFGPFRVIIFLSVIILLSLISLGLIGVDNGLDNSAISDEPSAQQNEAESISTKLENTDNSHNLDDDYFGRSLSSDAHLRIIGGLCVLLWTVHYDVFLILIFIPFFVAIFIKSGKCIGIFNVGLHLIDVLWLTIQGTVNKVFNIVVAGFLRKFVKLLFTSDRIFVTSLVNKVDLISSIFVMAALAIGSLFFLLFTVFQLHNETVHLVKLGVNVVSSNPDWMKYAVNYTEGQLGDHDIADYIEQGYQQGRKWLASNVRSLADPSDVGRADQLEEQVKLLVDNLYRMWTERNQDFNSTTKALYVMRASPTDWMIQLMSTSNFQALKGELVNAITENIETVFTIIQSLWSIVMMNVSILKTICGSILSLIFGFGFELMNLIIEFIVFLTAVYYLLASSDEQWLPLRLINDFSLATSSTAGQVPNIAKAFEDAISGVFVLSAKMSLFYGFYTYFVHSVFNLNIVFIPSSLLFYFLLSCVRSKFDGLCPRILLAATIVGLFLAGIFAAIPIMPPYIVGVIGFFEIYLVRGDTIAGIVFAFASVAPLFFADAAFYKEVKGSHPYVTGLAVIGGMYWLGLQGAIIGPIILCCVVALFNLYTEFVKSR